MVVLVSLLVEVIKMNIESPNRDSPLSKRKKGTHRREKRKRTVELGMDTKKNQVRVRRNME